LLLAAECDEPGDGVTIRSAWMAAAGVTIRSSCVTNRKASAVMIRCAQAAGPRDDPLRSLLAA
jgi:hypothetical protein